MRNQGRVAGPSKVKMSLCLCKEFRFLQLPQTGSCFGLHVSLCLQRRSSLHFLLFLFRCLPLWL